jgi:thiol-disulfide isomerase/thioredoxin
MRSVSRRAVLAAGGTLAVALTPRKPRAAELDPLNKVLQLVNPPVQPPDIAFQMADGTTHHLSEFKGHGMVVNLWATWCAPCVAELPALSRLSAALAPQDIAVLPLSSDRGGAKVVQAFFAAHDITGLPVLLDPKGAAVEAWGADGIPTTVIINRAGMERARLEGPANWADPAAAALIRRLVA